MASTTSVLGLTKPAYTDDADIGDINANADKIDAEAGRVRANFAGTYSASSAYAIGAYVIYQGNLYRCSTEIGSGGEEWNSTHWDQVSIGAEIAALNAQKSDKTHFTQASYNYRSYNTWQAAISANKSTLLPENGVFTFGFLTEGGAPHVFSLIKDGNYINGTHQVYNGYEEAVYSTDGGTNWTVRALSTQIATQAVQAYVPSCPANCSVYNNGCYYQKAGNVVTLYMSFKMENVTQTGFQGRFTITHNLPNGIKPTYTLTVFGDNGEANGYTSAGITNTHITIYPQKTGTTYFTGVVTYVV